MANIRTIDYKGFASASDGTGPKGWMLWSGSEDLSGSAYSGVGMELVAGSESYLKFDASADGAELDIRAKKFFIGTETSQFISGSAGNIEISSSLFHLDPQNNSLIIGADATINADLSVNNLFVPAGATASNAKAYISSSGVAKFSGDGAGNYNVDFTPGTSSIAGWVISSDRLQASNLIINSDGNIQTTNFQSSLVGTGQGWKIGSDGVAEFEEARIRGTLSTAVFEKDTISAVGGAVIIANATTISGSDIISTNTTFSVESSNGFVVGEYLVAKATSSTGFTEETFKIESTGSGTLMVSRSGAIPTMSSGQVIVSKAASGSGYILLNGSSGDYAPYMEMVERTGSGVDDLETKVLLGNLGSLGSSTGFGDLTGQTGLYTDNVYLKGAISASSGKIGGVSISSNKLHIGSGNYNDDNTEFYVDDTGQFSLKDKLTWDGSNLALTGTITIGPSSTSEVDFGYSASLSASAAETAAQGFADNAATSASNAQTAATNAAQGFADNAAASASTAQSTANAASSSAGYALASSSAQQTTIDGYVAQLVLANDAIEISTSGQSPDFGLARFGTTTNFYDGVGSAAANVKLRLNADGVRAYGDNTTTYADVTNEGLAIIDNDVEVGKFGATMRVGQDSATKSALRVDGSGNLTIGPQGKTNISMSAANGNVSFEGLVSAVNFSEKYVVVNSGNVANYTASNGAGVNLLFDGSGGGEITMNMQLDVDPGKIMDIIIPNAAASQSAEVQIVINANGCSYENEDISGGYATAATQRQN
tara:strand:+ start:7863 stop:10169 length:2307 start_codon:yes stop_codon:yes gene_type:complete